MKVTLKNGTLIECTVQEFEELNAKGFINESATDTKVSKEISNNTEEVREIDRRMRRGELRQAPKEVDARPIPKFERLNPENYFEKSSK